MNMKNVYIEHASRAYQELFESLGFHISPTVEGADLFCFTGGEDVTPSLYGDLKHPFTHNNSFRDNKEAKLFEHAVKNNIPMVGICRGGQFLNVMSGGRMYQHVEGHTVPHEITDLETGDLVYVSSTHHQMMMPSSEAVLVASSYLGGNREWYDGEVFKKDVSDQDYEVIFYPHTRSLCFQPHPEFSQPYYAKMRIYFRELMQKYLEV